MFRFPSASPSSLFSGLPVGLVAPLALSVCVSACGPIGYTARVFGVERTVAEARAQNAAYYAPYELYYAQAQLDKAHEEAAQGQYEDAMSALSLAMVYGRRALTRSAEPGAVDR